MNPDKITILILGLLLGFALGVYFEDKINTEKYEARWQRELLWRD